MAVADNSGAEIIVRDFHPRRLVLPGLRTKSPLEKTLPGTLALYGGTAESWQEGQHFDLAPGVSVEVLHPSATSTETHAQDRGLVLLFHAAGQTLLWAGKISPPVQQELLAAHPDLRADILVLDPDATPSLDWLRALQVRHWLQIPRRDRLLNAPTAEPDAGAVCLSWPLDQTGAVEIHFVAAEGAKPPEILLRPWVALPVPSL